MQACVRSDRRAPNIRFALRGIAGHIAAGLALGLLFVVLLIAWRETALRLLLQTDNAPALLILLVLHAGLFTCASLATANAGLWVRSDDDHGRRDPQRLLSEVRVTHRLR